MSEIIDSLMNKCDIVANNSKLPCRITDWACDLYIALASLNNTIMVKDLMLLSEYNENEPFDSDDNDFTLSKIDYELTRRGK